MKCEAASTVLEIGKRVNDILIALAGLLLTAPVMVLVALVVKCSSPGPIVFRQYRVGRWGVPFWVYKFRTMRAESDGPSLTAAGDSRITPVGHWLRYWKLDELPQLFNVLRGDMSLVGPRPSVPDFVRLEDPVQRRVLSVRPGITGPCQVWLRHEERLLAQQEDPEAYYMNTLLPAKLALDLEYVRHRSLLLDVRLLAQTLLVVLRPTAVMVLPGNPGLSHRSASDAGVGALVPASSFAASADSLAELTPALRSRNRRILQHANGKRGSVDATHWSEHLSGGRKTAYSSDDGLVGSVRRNH